MKKLSSPATGRSLTRRASLTFISTLLQQAARLIVGFVVTPILITGLGAELYGAWMMILYSVGYLGLSDLRAMGTLKFTLATQQHIEDVELKRRQIGASLLVFAATLPIILLLGGILILFTPSFIRTSHENIQAVQIAMALAVLSVALDRLLSLPANILRGVNLDYKAMGLNAATILLGGGLVILAVKSGWGLPGVAAASIAGIIFNSGIRYLVVRNVVPWFGVAKPTRQELTEFTKITIWLFVSGLGGLLLNSSDLLIVGILLGPASVSIYVTTGAVLRLARAPLEQLLSSGAPGISGICGLGDWTRVDKLRTDMQIVALSLLAVLGAAVIALNKPFLQLWVGDGFYAGDVTNFLLVLIAFVILLFRIDSVIVDAMLEFQPKAVATLISGLAIVLVGGLLCHFFGLSGIALGVFLGFLVLIVYLPFIITRRTGIKSHLRRIARPLVITSMLFILAYFWGKLSHPSTWFSLVGHALTVSGVCVVSVWFLGLKQVDRIMISRYLSELIHLKHKGIINDS